MGRASSAERTDRRPAPARGPRTHRESAARRLGQWRDSVVAGDRPYLAALVALLAVAALMLAGPVGRHLDSRDRIATLEQQRDVLGTEIERLEARAEDLHDPAHIELLAREQLGLVRPGEVPYVVVVPEQERPQVAPGSATVPEARPWHRRLLDAIGDVFR